MALIKPGDTVKLSPLVKNHTCPEGRDDNDTATVSTTYGVGGRSVQLNEDLHGCKYWNMDDLDLAE